MRDVKFDVGRSQKTCPEKQAGGSTNQIGHCDVVVTETLRQDHGLGLGTTQIQRRLEARQNGPRHQVWKRSKKTREDF